MTVPSSPLLTRAEAATYLRISLTTFKRLQPQLSQFMIRLGGKDLYDVRDVQRWADEQTGHVYLVEAVGSGFVKIGFTERPSAGERLAAIATGCPFPVRLVASYRGSLREERRLHSLFDSHRGPAGNEWFVDTPAIRDHFADQQPETM